MTRAIDGVIPRFPALSHQARNARSSLAVGATTASKSWPCSCACSFGDPLTSPVRGSGLSSPGRAFSECLRQNGGQYASAHASRLFHVVLVEAVARKSGHL